MKNIVNNYSSIEQLTNQYLNKQKSTDKKINGISFEEILKQMSSLRHMQALESVEPYLIRSGKWTGFQEQSDKGKGK